MSITDSTRCIVAIGGGRVGTGRPQTTDIDREIVRLAGRRRPHLVFLPTASQDAADYCEAIIRHFGGRLGCSVDALLLYRDRPGPRELAARIAAADIIYVGGGNTLRMMRLWRHLGVDRLIDAARRRGTVLSGLSAGAICWFRAGNSDARKFSNPRDKTLIRVRGLGFVDALVCPHYDSEHHRQMALKTMMRTTAGVAIALEDCAAIEIVGEQYRILGSRSRAQAYRVYWRSGHYHSERLRPHSDFRRLGSLLDRISDLRT
jgi:dipeptidase E